MNQAATSNRYQDIIEIAESEELAAKTRILSYQADYLAKEVAENLKDLALICKLYNASIAAHSDRESKNPKPKTLNRKEYIETADIIVEKLNYIHDRLCDFYLRETREAIDDIKSFYRRVSDLNA